MVALIATDFAAASPYDSPSPFFFLLLLLQHAGCSIFLLRHTHQKACIKGMLSRCVCFLQRSPTCLSSCSLTIPVLGTEPRNRLEREERSDILPKQTRGAKCPK